MINTVKRFDVIVAQPGWFAFEWDRFPLSSTHDVRKMPIVAWLVDLAIFPNRPDGEMRDFCAGAYPITFIDMQREAVIGPGGIVYRLKDGRTWDNVGSYVEFEEAAEQEAAK